MEFQSFNFLAILLPVTFVIHYFSGTISLRNSVLTCASYAFYSWGNPYFALLLLSSTLTDFYIGQSIDSARKEEIDRARASKAKKVTLLIVSLVINLGMLFCFKYWDWIVTRELYGIDFSPLRHGIDVPPGISFYTFQTLSYTIDIYRGRIRSEKNISNYLLYVSFFPQLIAGPIERAASLLPQITRFRPNVSHRVVSSALTLIFWGLFKKVVIADNIGLVVERADNSLHVPGAGVVVVLGFCLQIYCDFSAYSDIARGLGRLFGIRLRRNFLTPLFATSPSDFWRRWHISLSTWIRDYLYIPLGGNRRNLLRNTFNVLFTMSIMGMWHGASKYFLFWGIYNALLILFYRIFPIDKYLASRLGQRAGTITAIAIMFMLMQPGWLLFFVRDNAHLHGLIGSIAGLSLFVGDATFFDSELYAQFRILAIFYLVIIVTDYIGYRKDREFAELLLFVRPEIKLLIFILLTYGFIWFYPTRTFEFIYFQF